MTNIKNPHHLLVISVMALLGLVGSSAEAARSPRGLASFSIGYRFESGAMEQGLTLSASGDSRFYQGIAFFGVIDLHSVRTGWSGSMSAGAGGWVGFKLRVRPRNPGFKLSPGLAFGALAFPKGVFGYGQHASVRLSLEAANVLEKGGGLLVEFSVIQVLSDIETWGNTRRSLDPLISLRVGFIMRSL